MDGRSSISMEMEEESNLCLIKSPMPNSACLIFNPVSGQSNPEQDLAQIRKTLEPGLDLDIRFTTEKISAAQLAREAVQRQVEVLIASGGDGTVSAVAAALVGSEIPLGVIARGTANAFAVSLQIPIGVEEACQTILAGYTHRIDALTCNGQPLMLLAGIGFEAEAIARAGREAKNRFGNLAYIWSAMQQLGEMEHFDVELTTEKDFYQFHAVGLSVANVAPPTSLLAQGPAHLEADDGLLDVTIFAPAGIPGAIAASYHLFQTALTGNPVTRPDVGYVRAQRVTIVTNPPQKLMLDGDLIGTTPATVECIPNAIAVIVPESPPEGPLQRVEEFTEKILAPLPEADQNQ